MSEERKMIRAGDTIVNVDDSDRTYVAACDEEQGYVYTAGWPEALEKVENYRVQRAATDEERLEMLLSVASRCTRPGEPHSGRQARAASLLHRHEVETMFAEMRSTRVPGGITDDMKQIHAWAESKGWTTTELHLPNGDVISDVRLCAERGDIERNTEPTAVFIEGVSSKLALIHSEVTEALEELRSGPGHLAIRIDQGTKKPDGFVVELADVVIRIEQLCGALGLDLETAKRVKLSYNNTRPFRHGGKTA